MTPMIRGDDGIMFRLLAKVWEWFRRSVKRAVLLIPGARSCQERHRLTPAVLLSRRYTGRNDFLDARSFYLTPSQQYGDLLNDRRPDPSVGSSSSKQSRVAKKCRPIVSILRSPPLNVPAGSSRR